MHCVATVETQRQVLRRGIRMSRALLESSAWTEWELVSPLECHASGRHAVVHSPLLYTHTNIYAYPQKNLTTLVHRFKYLYKQVSVKEVSLLTVHRSLIGKSGFS